MKYGPRDILIGLNNSDISNAVETHQQRTELSQYTDYDALKFIFCDRTLKLNRVDNVNDLNEKKIIAEKEIYQRVYISCFTHRIDEYIPHWHMYAYNNGVRITFHKKKGVSFHELLLDVSRPITGKFADKNDSKYRWLFKPSIKVPEDLNKWKFDIHSLDVQYGKKFIENNPIHVSVQQSNKIDMVPLAAFKYEPWEFEEESRIVAFARTVYDNIDFDSPNYILIPITFDNLVKISITFSPWMSDKLKDEIREFIKKQTINEKIEIICKDSNFDGTIDPK